MTTLNILLKKNPEILIKEPFIQTQPVYEYCIILKT